jgi:hypothetical protein
MVQTVPQLAFGILRGKQVIGSFNGGDISSDGGVLLLAEAERRTRIIAALAATIIDERDPARVRHSVEALLRQRIYAIACGYEDCNDFDQLRSDPAFKLAVGRLPEGEPDLASQPTLSRLENSVSAGELLAMSAVLLDQFVAGHEQAPTWVVLDFDATDDETHGQQQLSGFHGFYDEHCYLPLIVTARVDGGPDELLAAVLRPGKSHASRGALAVLQRIVARLREAWPEVRILLRGDSGFALPEIYDWCEENGVWYLIGLASNNCLQRRAEPHLAEARAEFAATGEKVRRLYDVGYAAGSWSRLRRVLIKAEVSAQGDNPRYVVTSLGGDPLLMYDLYARRGEMENRIKELKCDLAMDRTSCHRFLANQFRLLLHAVAFVLLSVVRGCLTGTDLARAQVGTLRCQLLKLGVLVRQTCRKVWLQFASSCPVQQLWPLVLTRLRA